MRIVVAHVCYSSSRLRQENCSDIDTRQPGIHSETEIQRKKDSEVGVKITAILPSWWGRVIIYSQKHLGPGFLTVAPGGDLTELI